MKKKTIKSFVKDSYSAGRYPFANHYFTYPNLELASKYISLKRLFVMEISDVPSFTPPSLANRCVPH